MYILRVFPDKSADAGVFWDGFVAAAVGFIVGRQPFDGTIVYERVGNGGNFRGKDKGNVIVKDGNRIGPALWKTG